MGLPDGKSSHAEVLARRGGEVVRRLDALHRPVGVEVGVYRGALAACVLTALPALVWHMVDPWSPPDKLGSYYASGDSVSRLDRAAFEGVYRDAVSRTAFAGDRAVIHRADSVAAAHDIPDGSVDLVFIDGDHSPEGVARDLTAWFLKVRPGGWIGGHDWRPPGNARGWHVGPAVTRWFDRMGLDPRFEFGRDKTWFYRRAA